MIRVYDTNALWRHDEIIRIRHLEAEMADMGVNVPAVLRAGLC